MKSIDSVLQKPLETLKCSKFGKTLTNVCTASREGLDYFETFSPVVRYETIRVLLAIIVENDMITKQFDVKTAFLYGCVDTDIYMSQPEGFDDSTGRVCKLNKSLYGLKQGPRLLNERFINFVKNLGFKISDFDPGLYILIQNNVTILIALYVDDGLAASNSSKELDKILRLLGNEFKIKINDLSYYLGIEIHRSSDGISINQNPEFHKKTKHIDIKYNFVRDYYRKEFFDVVYVPSEFQAADLLTKPLTALKLNKAKMELNLGEVLKKTR